MPLVRLARSQFAAGCQGRAFSEMQQERGAGGVNSARAQCCANGGPRANINTTLGEAAWSYSEDGNQTCCDLS